MSYIDLEERGTASTNFCDVHYAAPILCEEWIAVPKSGPHMPAAIQKQSSQPRLLAHDTQARPLGIDANNGGIPKDTTPHPEAR